MVGALRDGERSGRSLRAVLAEKGVVTKGPAFYQLMGRMEKAGLITERFEDGTVGTTVVKERIYAITDVGRNDWGKTLDFVLFYSGIDPNSLTNQNKPQT